LGLVARPQPLHSKLGRLIESSEVSDRHTGIHEWITPRTINERTNERIRTNIAIKLTVCQSVTAEAVLDSTVFCLLTGGTYTQLRTHHMHERGGQTFESAGASCGSPLQNEDTRRVGRIQAKTQKRKGEVEEGRMDASIPCE